MHIISFEERLNRKGEAVHWMMYAANPMEAQLCATSARVKEFIPTQQDWDAPDSNEHAAVKKLRWEKFVKPAYEAWKNGHEVPTGGTPLSAWLELGKPQVEAFRKAGVASVEQVAEMNDTVMGMIPLPNKHALKEAAKRFLATKDSQAMADEMAALRAELEAMKSGKLKKYEGYEVLTPEPMQKPKRGRPKKVEADDAGDDGS